MQQFDIELPDIPVGYEANAGEQILLPTYKSGFLIDKLGQEKPLILVPQFQNKPGHPTFFSTELAPQFLEIRGDIGGRQIIDTFHQETLFIDVSDKGVSLDMDNYMESDYVC